ALRIRELAARLPELTDVARLGRTFSGDPEMVRLLTPLLDEWAASTEPAERVRAEVLRAGMLGEQGAESWGAAIDRASDPSVRYALLSAPPVSGAAAADRPYVDRLISVAAADPDAKARAAALSGLPAELPADALDRLAGGAGRERDAAVRADLVRLLGRSRSDAAGVVRTLREIGFDAAEDRGIRREALAGLARAASAHPDLLTATEMETLEKTLGELDR
ncbi:MAG: hypothetical protein HZA54_10685, partial [Planctomycetes bacterium]|nr:hypothetical protein [Planctomycetota bacterium]